MNDTSPKWPAKSRAVGVAVCCGGITLAVLLAYPLIALWGQRAHGDASWVSAALAGGVCWLGAILALVSTAVMRGPQAALYALLFGMVFRMGIPLVVGVALQMQRGWLAEVGVFSQIMAFYLVTLPVETYLSLRFVRPAGLSATTQSSAKLPQVS